VQGETGRLPRVGISTQALAGNIAKNGQTAEVAISVQSPKRRVASCAANELARAVVEKTSGFANQKIANFRKQIFIDEKQVALINQAPRARRPVRDRPAAAPAPPRDDPAGSAEHEPAPAPGDAGRGAAGPDRRHRAEGHGPQPPEHTVVVAALIGLILGAIAALMWDGVAAGMSRRRGE